jgi:DNA-binding NarL/FixJ family response regulator
MSQTPNRNRTAHGIRAPGQHPDSAEHPYAHLPLPWRLLLVSGDETFAHNLAVEIGAREGSVTVVRCLAAAAGTFRDEARVASYDVWAAEACLPDGRGETLAQDLASFGVSRRLILIDDGPDTLDPDVFKNPQVMCVPKSTPPAHLAAILNHAASDPVVLAVGAFAKIFLLSQMEARVLSGCARGFDGKELSGELGCAPATVDSHWRRILRKSGFAGRKGGAQCRPSMGSRQSGLGKRSGVYRTPLRDRGSYGRSHPPSQGRNDLAIFSLRPATTRDQTARQGIWSRAHHTQTRLKVRLVAMFHSLGRKRRFAMVRSPIPHAAPTRAEVMRAGRGFITLIATAAARPEKMPNMTITFHLADAISITVPFCKSSCKSRRSHRRR